MQQKGDTIRPRFERPMKFQRRLKAQAGLVDTYGTHCRGRTDDKGNCRHSHLQRRPGPCPNIPIQMHWHYYFNFGGTISRIRPPQSRKTYGTSCIVSSQEAGASLTAGVPTRPPTYLRLSRFEVKASISMAPFQGPQAAHLRQ